MGVSSIIFPEKRKKVLFDVLHRFQKTFAPGGPNSALFLQGNILLFQKITIIRKYCKFPHVSYRASRLILSLENVSLGPLETFWSQGCMFVKRIFHEIHKNFENLTIMANIYHFSKPPKMC